MSVSSLVGKITTHKQHQWLVEGFIKQYSTDLHALHSDSHFHILFKIPMVVRS